MAVGAFLKSQMILGQPDHLMSLLLLEVTKSTIWIRMKRKLLITIEKLIKGSILIVDSLNILKKVKK